MSSPYNTAKMAGYLSIRLFEQFDSLRTWEYTKSELFLKMSLFLEEEIIKYLNEPDPK